MNSEIDVNGFADNGEMLIPMTPFKVENGERISAKARRENAGSSYPAIRHYLKLLIWPVE